MPVGTLIAPWAQVSGKFAGAPTLDPGNGEIVAMPQPNGQTNIRRMFTPVQPNTPMQLAMRAFMASVSEAFQNLTLEQVQGWKNLAEQLVASNRFGVDYTPSWNNVFSQVNNLRLSNGLTILEDAPAFAPVPLIDFPAAGPAVKSVEDTPDWVLTVPVRWLVPASAVNTAMIRLRFTRSTNSPVLQIPANELRMVADEPSNNWNPSATTATFNLEVISTRLNIAPTDRVGVEVFVTNAAGVPSQRLWARNVLVTAP
jgi:hypothetical protein